MNAGEETARAAQCGVGGPESCSAAMMVGVGEQVDGRQRAVRENPSVSTTAGSQTGCSGRGERERVGGLREVARYWARLARACVDRPSLSQAESVVGS